MVIALQIYGFEFSTINKNKDLRLFTLWKCEIYVVCTTSI